MENFLLSAKSCDIISLCYIKKIKDLRQQLKNISLLFNNSYKNFVQFSKIFCNVLLCNVTHAIKIYLEYQLKALRFYEENKKPFLCFEYATENFLQSAKFCFIIFFCYGHEIKDLCQRLKNISLFFNNTKKILCSLVKSYAILCFFKCQLNALRFY